MDGARDKRIFTRGASVGSIFTSAHAWMRCGLLIVISAVNATYGYAGPAAAPDQDHLTAFQKSLTDSELAWLLKHRDIRLGIDPAWEPFEFLDSAGRYRGMASEYIDLLNAMLDTHMSPVRGLSWPEVIDGARAGEIDVLPCVVRTPQREAYLNFTDTYLDFPMVIMTRESESFAGGLEDLRGQKIGVVKGYATVDLLAEHYPDLERVEFKTLNKGLEALSSGQIPVFVDNLASIAQATTSSMCCAS